MNDEKRIRDIEQLKADVSEIKYALNFLIKGDEKRRDAEHWASVEKRIPKKKCSHGYGPKSARACKRCFTSGVKKMRAMRDRAHETNSKSLRK